MEQDGVWASPAEVTEPNIDDLKAELARWKGSCKDYGDCDTFEDCMDCGNRDCHNHVVAKSIEKFLTKVTKMQNALIFVKASLEDFSEYALVEEVVEGALKEAI